MKRLLFWIAYRILPSWRMHVINTGLPPGYHDPDKRIEAAIFQLCVEYCGNLKEICNLDNVWFDPFEEAASFWAREKNNCINNEDYKREERQRLLLNVITNLGKMWYP